VTERAQDSNGPSPAISLALSRPSAPLPVWRRIDRRRRAAV